MKKVIITGAGGFIGSAVTTCLLDRGITVYGVDVSNDYMKKYREYSNFQPVVLDFSQYHQLHEIIRDEIDVFYHFAWQGGLGRESFQNYRIQLDNEKYACDALMEAVQIGCRKFVFAGTVNEYEMETYIHMDSFSPRYTYIYSATKQAGEAICKTLAYHNGINFCAGRIAMAYGEGNRAATLPNVVIRNCLTGTPCNLVEGKNLYDMIYAGDIGRAFEKIGENGKNMKSYYVGHRKLKTFREIITEMAEILNPDCSLLFGKYPDEPSGVDYTKIDLDALYNDTGFECNADFRGSILKTADWLKSDLEKYGGGL